MWGCPGGRPNINYAWASGNPYANVLTDHGDLDHVVSTDFTENSAGGADPWMNLRSMRACSGAAETGALPPVATTTAWCWSSGHADDTAANWYPQALSYRPVLDATQVEELWGLTEQPGQRAVFAVGFTDPAVPSHH